MVDNTAFNPLNVLRTDTVGVFGFAFPESGQLVRTLFTLRHPGPRLELPTGTWPTLQVVVKERPWATVLCKTGAGTM